LQGRGIGRGRWRRGKEKRVGGFVGIENPEVLYRIFCVCLMGLRLRPYYAMPSFVT
jgi:hypothetical protein